MTSSEAKARDMRDIYDPPPAPATWEPPKPRPMVYTRGDLACLAAFVALLSGAAALAWTVEPSLAALVTLGGALVILESWFTALGFLNVQPAMSLRARWAIFVGALAPWLIGLGVAAALMLGLFRVSDWMS